MKRRTLILGGAALAAVGGGAAATIASMGSAEAYAQAMAAQRGPLGAAQRDLVRYATLAANGHNTQPWRFRVSESAIRIRPDLSRRTPVVDPDDHHLYVSLGCAAENLVLAAASRGLRGEARFDPAGDGEIFFEHEAGPEQRSDLFDAIPRRQSTRGDFDGRTASASDLNQLQRAGEPSGVALTLITERAAMDRVRDLIIAGNTAQMTNPAFMAELKAWLRFNPGAALRHGDGLYSAASGNPALPDWLGPAMFDLTFKPEAENDKYARQIATSSGLAVFSGAAADHAGWISVGRACQRFALQATALGMKLSFVNQPVEEAAFRPELAALIGLPERRPDIVMRFGYGADLPMSPRRPPEAVLDA